jgi:DNA replication protein DnaC
METAGSYNSNRKQKTSMSILPVLSTIIPKKYLRIECDKPDLVQQGLEKSLYITGSCGVGKTVLMAGVVKELVRQDKRVEWYSYPELIMNLQNLYRKDTDDTAFDVAEKIAEFSGTLCIDDLGAEKITDFVRQTTYYIINKREQECLHTIITSNFTLAEIDDQIDPRIGSRIAGMCEIITLKGRDRRLDKGGNLK